MNDEEKKDFESHLRNDPEMREEVMKSLKTIEEAGREEIRKQAASGFEKMEQQIVFKKSRAYRALGIAASLLILISFSIAWLLPGQPDLGKLYVDNYEFHRVGSRSMPEHQDSAWNEALDHYEIESKQDFPKAILKFNQLLESPGFYAKHANEVYLYLGISYLETGEAVMAIEAFRKVDASAAGFYGPAVWYTALTYLQLEDEINACESFNEIREDHRWSIKRRATAEKIWKKLDCD